MRTSSGEQEPLSKASPGCKGGHWYRWKGFRLQHLSGYHLLRRRLSWFGRYLRGKDNVQYRSCGCLCLSGLCGSKLNWVSLLSLRQ